MNVTKICVYPIFPTGIEKYNVKQKDNIDGGFCNFKKVKVKGFESSQTKEPWILYKEKKRF